MKEATKNTMMRAIEKMEEAIENMEEEAIENRKK